MEPIPFESRWYSHKFHGPAVRYEVRIGVYNGFIVWVNGPFPAGEWSDSPIVQDSFLRHLCQDEVFIANGGYKGVDYCIMPGDYGNVNWKFKELKAIGDMSRHTQVQHGKMFWGSGKLRTN